MADEEIGAGNRKTRKTREEMDQLFTGLLYLWLFTIFLFAKDNRGSQMVQYDPNRWEPENEWQLTTVGRSFDMNRTTHSLTIWTEFIVRGSLLHASIFPIQPRYNKGFPVGISGRTKDHLELSRSDSFQWIWFLFWGNRKQQKTLSLRYEKD